MESKEDLQSLQQENFRLRDSLVKRHIELAEIMKSVNYLTTNEVFQTAHKEYEELTERIKEVYGNKETGIFVLAERLRR